MQIVIKYAKRRTDERETYRWEFVTVPQNNWVKALEAAGAHILEHERIVMIAEGGYH
jgi:hypothetical protein